MMVAVVIQEIQYKLRCEPSWQVEGIRVFTKWSAHSCWWPGVLHYSSYQVIFSSAIELLAVAISALWSYVYFLVDLFNHSEHT
jgi:hypothetical protein